MFEYCTTHHPCKVLNRVSWGAHINQTKYVKFFPEYPDWLNPLQKQEWRDRGLVLWDATTRYAQGQKLLINPLFWFLRTQCWAIF